MANNSDRAYFLERIKQQPMTIQDIINEFGCAEGTARNWVKHPEVEKVIGSWPTAFVRKNSLAPITPQRSNAPVPNNVIRYDIPEPSPEQKEQFFRAVLGGEQQFNFTEEFRNADSQKDILVIMSKLKSALIVSEYYLSLMKKEGTA